MHPSISIFPNRSFYEGKISDAPSVMEKEHQKKYLPGSMFGAYSFVNIEEGREEIDELGHSRKNMVEAVVIKRILHKLQRGMCILFYELFNYAYILFFIHFLAYFCCTEERAMDLAYLMD